MKHHQNQESVGELKESVDEHESEHSIELSQSITPLGGSWWTDRLLLCLIALGIYALYHPFTKIAMNLSPVDMSVNWDQMIELSPGWIVIYAMIYPAATSPLFHIKDLLIFRQVIYAYILLEVMVLSLFLLFPVHMHLRPELSSLTGEGFFVWGLQFCYWADRPSGCFPSLHVATATLAALCHWRVSRVIGVVFGIIAILISLSTLLIKQHFIADVFAGIALSLGVYWFCIHRHITSLNSPTTSRETSRDSSDLCLSRWWLLIPLFFFIIMISLFYLLYLQDWRPWTL